MLGRGLVLWRVHRIDPGRYVVGNCDAALQKVREFRLMMKSMGTSVRRVWLAGLIAVAAALTFASGAFAHGSPATLSARGSVEQVQVTGATPGDQVDLLAKGQVVDSKPAGELGGVVFRKVEPGGGYTVSSNGTTSAKLKVLTARSAPPSTDIYDQDLEDGYGYLTTRDGTKLAIDVHLPGPPEDGPYPTLVEYSGYGYANPAGPQSGIQPVAALLGYAVVDINMRGTGCSGGAFDYFETLQSLDGYDAIETVANQPWVLHNKVGMLGISYGGISQLFVAATRPPSLAAITPLSVIDNTQTTLYPGGILNTGFALEWAQDRVDDSQPASPTTGQAWAWDRIEGGDTVCAANQDLHPEATNLLAKTRRNKFYRPKVADPLSPIKFVHKIDVPVFLACQWTDEQTGGHCPAMVDEFTGTNRKWFTFTNGVHTDSLDPETFNRWYDFMQIYVAKQKPEMSAGVKGRRAGDLFSRCSASPASRCPTIRSRPSPTSRRPRPPSSRCDRSGSCSTTAPPMRRARPAPGSRSPSARFPLPKTSARSWYLGRGGKLRDKAGGDGADQFTWDDEARPATDFTGNTGSGDLWTAHPTTTGRRTRPATRSRT